MKTARSRALIVCSVLVALVAALYSASPWLDRVLFAADYRRFESVTIGMTHSEVLDLLGGPNAECAKTDSTNCRVDGYTFKDRPVHGRLLVYQATEHVAYIYLDENDRVEEVFLAGS